MSATLTGQYIVADPEICYGKPTFRGTRIMVWQVLGMLAKGQSWEAITKAWGGRVPPEYIAEALQFASEALQKPSQEQSSESILA